MRGNNPYFKRTGGLNQIVAIKKVGTTINPLFSAADLLCEKGGTL
jgi:hypothetical protein